MDAITQCGNEGLDFPIMSAAPTAIKTLHSHDFDQEGWLDGPFSVARILVPVFNHAHEPFHSFP